MNEPRPALSVILPVFRTERYIDELHARLVTAIGDRELEIVCVDDASPEGAAPLLRRLATTDARIVVVSHPANRGQGHAVMSGLRASRGDAVVVMDADLQDPPEAIPLLLAQLDAGRADAVFATRHNQYSTRGRAVTGKVFKLLLRRLVQVPLGAGSFVAMRRDLVERLLTLDAAHPYLLGMIGRTATRIESVATLRAPRSDGMTAWTATMRTRVALRALYDVAVTWRT